MSESGSRAGRGCLRPRREYCREKKAEDWPVGNGTLTPGRRKSTRKERLSEHSRRKDSEKESQQRAVKTEKESQLGAERTARERVDSAQTERTCQWPSGRRDSSGKEQRKPFRSKVREKTQSGNLKTNEEIVCDYSKEREAAEEIRERFQ